jgi:hypothetical protein
VVPASQALPPELLPELPPLELPPESVLPELLPEPLLDPDPLDDEDVASLPPASPLWLPVLDPPEQLAIRPAATTNAPIPPSVRFILVNSAFSGGAPLGAGSTGQP